MLNPETLCVKSYVCEDTVQNHISAIIYVLPNTCVQLVEHMTNLYGLALRVLVRMKKMCVVSKLSIKTAKPKKMRLLL